MTWLLPSEALTTLAFEPWQEIICWVGEKWDKQPEVRGVYLSSNSGKLHYADGEYICTLTDDYYKILPVEFPAMPVWE